MTPLSLTVNGMTCMTPETISARLADAGYERTEAADR